MTLRMLTADRPPGSVMSRRAARVRLAAGCLCAGLTVASGFLAPAASAYTAYVSNLTEQTLSPINTVTNIVGSTIAVKNPPFLAITPDGSTALVTDTTQNTVTPIALPSGTPGTPISVGSSPFAIAITPDGTKAYVADHGSESVTPINLTTKTAGLPIKVGKEPYAIAITPDGSKVYVTNYGSGSVTPITVASNTAGAPITVGGGPQSIAITPEGTTAWVADFTANTITPITLATNTAGATITVKEPNSLAITPEGGTAYVTNYGQDAVTPVNLLTKTAGTSIKVGAGPYQVAITPDGATAYVTDDSAGSVTPINTATQTAGAEIKVGEGPDGIAITPDQAPVASFTVTAEPAGSPSSFNASASSVAYGTITSYAWKFGDGATATTSTPTTTHTYAAEGAYTATLTETDSAGTSATQVFTGQTVSRNGGANAQTTRSVTVPPPAPVNSTLPSIAGIAQQNLALTEVHGTWTNSPTGYSYQWLRCNSAGEGCSAISGATGQTYTLLAEDVGHRLRVQETASNAGGSSAPAVSAATAVVLPAVPVSITLPSITGTMQQAQALTEVHGAWTNSPTGYSYQWLRCNSAGEGCSAISGATGQTYTLLAEDVGHRLRVQETASNAGGPSSPEASPVSAVVNPLPQEAPSLVTYVPLGLQTVLSDPPPRPTPPVISIRSLTVNRHGVGVIPLRCPASATDGCRGKVTIAIHIIQPHARRASAARCARGCRPLASTNYEARAGQKVRVRVHIASFGRRLLSEHSSVRVTLSVTSVVDGQMASTTRAIAMKA
jgi:YVTN family beta-propeller protein